MLSPLTRRMEDHSTAACFSFSFYCDICGKEWRSGPVPFVGREKDASLDDKVTQLIWQSQHAAAYERANQEAIFWHNRCQICSKWVCQDCFCVREDEPSDVCVTCRDKEL